MSLSPVSMNNCQKVYFKANDGDAKASASQYVPDASEEDKVELSTSSGKKSALKAKVTYDGDSFDTNEDYVWSSKNKSVATISENGKVVAVKAGKTYIICSSQSGNVKVRCKIIVRNPYNPVKTIKFDKDQMRLNKKDKRVLKPIITYGDKKKKKYAHEELIWSSSNNKVATVNKNGKVTGKSNGTAYIKATSKYTNKSVKCKVFVQNTKYIAITFDDGPGERTHELLDMLEKYDAHATFFMQGIHVSEYADDVERMKEIGCEIGNHSYDHPQLTGEADGGASQVAKTNELLKQACGQPATVLIPPYGAVNDQVKAAVGMPMILWNIDTLDWKTKDTQSTIDCVLNTADDGDIVLMHDIHSSTVDAALQLIPKLIENGYQLVTVSEMAEARDIILENGKVYTDFNK